MHGPFHANDLSLKVKDAWDILGNWSFNKLSFEIPFQICDIIWATRKPFSSSLSDLPTWNASPNGNFDTHSAYLIAVKFWPISASSWKWLWKVPTIPRVISFLWLACHNYLSTKAHLVTRHILSDDSYPLCHSNSETPIHILYDCLIILPI